MYTEKAIFVNRDREIQAFHQYNGEHYIDYTGVCGIGKTTLVQKVLGQHVNNANSHFVYIDCHQFDRNGLTILVVLQEIVSQICRGLPKDEGNPFYAFNRGGQLLFFPEHVRLNDFNDGLQELLKYNSVLLCLDGTEAIYRHPLVWEQLEKKALQQHFEKNNLTVVTTNPKATIWISRAFKRKRKEICLSCLNIEHTREQIAMLCDQHGVSFTDQQWIAKQMHKLTMGHPLSNRILTEFWIRKFKPRTLLNRQVVQGKIKSGIIYLIKELITKCDARLELDEKTYPNQVKILAVFALPRRITPDLAFFLLDKFRPEICKERNLRFFQTFLDAAVKADILETDGFLLKLTPVIRNILLKYIQINEKPIADRADEMIINYYHELSEKVFCQRVEHLPELLYHKASMCKTDSGMNQSVQNELTEFLKKYSGIMDNSDQHQAYSQLFSLKNSMLRDKELAETGVNMNALANIIEPFVEGE